MNNLTVFNNAAFGDLRTIEKDGEIWFIASDVAKALGYQKPANAVARHCRYTLNWGIPHPQGKGVLEVNIIPEGDLYRLIIGSKLPSAELFERWVFDEVLPSIRKTGKYSVQQRLPQTYIEALEALVASEKEKEKLSLAKAETDAQNAILAPKAEYTDNVLSSEGYMTVTQIAKDYGRSAKWLNGILQAEGVQYKQSGQWMLYAKFADKSYTVSGTHAVGDNSFVSTYWTQEGRKFIYDLLKEKYNLVPRETVN